MIVRRSMFGREGYLSPPTHPMIEWAITHDNRMWPLDAAVDPDQYDELEEADRVAAREILARWQPPPIDGVETQAWIASVLTYYAFCYRHPALREPRCWDDRFIVIDAKRDPFVDLTAHAGVHWIRRFYPLYEPTAEALAEACQ